MNLHKLLEDTEQTQQQAAELIDAAANAQELATARNALLGRKSGRVTDLMRAVPELATTDRRAGGAAVNSLKLSIETLLAEAEARLGAGAEPLASVADPTMPARKQWRGGRHPVSIVLDEVADIFRELGFTIVTGPEAETSWYNFGALNFPDNHPAMDLHDTLYIGGDILLRTHTSPVQIRTLQKFPPPIRVLVPGQVYRRDFFDPSHAPAFAQLEGLAVDEDVSFVDLKATLTVFANRFFGKTRTRFRPSFFPFTEPSAEMDVLCQLCQGAGCSSCKHSGWMEILGSGMVHPAVLESAGVDSERFSGWAFGMGPARIAMLRYGIPDIRILYDSDMRFLEQFAE